MYTLKLAVSNVCIYLCSTYVRVAKQHLNCAQGGAVVEEIGGKRVANYVGSDFLGDAGLHGPIFHDTLDRAWIET